MTRRCVLLSLATILVATVPAAGWGRRGHALATRLAVAALPAGMPGFLRQAAERLAYQASEPDRWRRPSAPALTGATQGDHHFDTELWGADPIPATRSDLLVAAFQRGLVGAGKPVSALGTAPVGAVEMAERLTADFRYWRECTAHTEAERAIRRQVEANVLYTAGILAHYVTDLANPLHASVHSGGWAPGFPNPRGYVAKPGQGIHGRFESLYVQESMSEKGVAAHMTALRRLGSWSKELEQHTRRSHSFMEQAYQFEQRGAWGSGKEPPEARAFTAARLAEGASLLRDIIYTAWLISGEEWLKEPVAYIGRNGRTLLQQMQELHEIEPRHHLELGGKKGAMRVVGIDNRKNGLDGRQWRAYINNQRVDASADRHFTKAYDRIEYRFEKAVP